MFFFLSYFCGLYVLGTMHFLAHTGCWPVQFHAVVRPRFPFPVSYELRALHRPQKLPASVFFGGWPLSSAFMDSVSSSRVLNFALLILLYLLPDSLPPLLKVHLGKLGFSR